MDHLELTPNAVVTELYRSLLHREPDSTGLQAYSATLADKTSTLADIVDRIIHSDEFRAKAMPLIYGSAAVNPERFTNDVSQYGELNLLLKLWINSGARHRIVVDVGARGLQGSNSYDLMRTFGWKGLLIEANPTLIPTIQGDFRGLDMELINCAVSDYDGTAEFHIGVNDDVSSLDQKAALGWGAITATIHVPVVRLGTLLKAHNIPKDFDLLSIDIEGEDIKVLNDLMSHEDYEPRWIIIEASYDFKTKSLEDLPFSNVVRSRYRIVGQTKSNLILGLA